MNRLSLITTVLNSHEIVRRQLMHLASFVAPNIELILIDDGSIPPLEPIIRCASIPFSLILYSTNDQTPWTQPRARNIGGRISSGDYLVFFDIDHIITPEIISLAASFEGDKFHWRRKPGNIDGTGKLDAIELPASPGESFNEIHPNSFVIKKTIWEKMRGYDEGFCGNYGGDDVDFLQRFQHLVRIGEAKSSDVMGTGYVFSDPAQNAFFHGLSRTPTNKNAYLV